MSPAADDHGFPDNPAGSDADPGAIFASLATIIYARPDFFEIYRAVCNAAPLLVTGCDHASLMLRRNGRLITAAASSEVARQIDELEREIGEGPCLDAILDEAAYVDADLTAGSPWPRLADEILEHTTVRGAAGFRLIAEHQKVGALNLFSDTPGALTDDSVDQAAVLAAFTSVALAAVSGQQSADTLKAGLDSNREVGKAIGLLMAFHKINDEQAFDILRKASQDMNVKLSVIAREVVDHHNKR
jgi:transcriptional regulator with GAF, ATPase, and Fis domain